MTSNDIACNVDGTDGTGVETVAASAGDTITVQWDQSTHPSPITHFRTYLFLFLLVASKVQCDTRKP